MSEPDVAAHGRLCCVAGLGNPGSKYERTPHNLGWWVLEELARRHAIRIAKSEHGCLTGAGFIRMRNVALVKPQTFMNNSGECIANFLRYRNLTNHDLIVVYDELDLPWTALRIKAAGSSAGHNGVKSIIAALKTNVFTRVRVGIHPNHETADAVQYVLAPLEPELRPDADEIVSYTADAIETVIAEGAAKAMAKFNRRARSIQEEE